MELIQLRDYQQEVYDKVRKSMAAGHRRVLVVMPCRTGKSYIFAKMAEKTAENGGDTLILVHRRELKAQHEKLINDADITRCRTSMVITESHHPVEDHPTVIVTDEAHLSMAASYKKVLNDLYPDSYVMGFTATPIRLDGKPLGDIYQDLVLGPSVQWAIDNHFMSDYDYYAPECFDLKGVRTTAGDYNKGQLNALMMSQKNDRIYSDVLKSWERLSGKCQTIAYCVSIEHAEMMAARFRDAGYPAEAVSSENPSAERDDIMKRFTDGEFLILCNVGIISEGVTIPNVGCCLLLRPTKSHALYWQQAMRCLTYQDGKKAVILDCVGNVTRNPQPKEDCDEDRIEWSITAKPKRKKKHGLMGDEFRFKTCLECYMSYPSNSQICPYCGAENPTKKRKMEEIKEVELKKVEAARKRKQAMERNPCYIVGDCNSIGEGLLRLKANRSSRMSDYEALRKKFHPEYKQGWSWHKYQEHKKRWGIR